MSGFDSGSEILINREHEPQNKMVSSLTRILRYTDSAYIFLPKGEDTTETIEQDLQYIESVLEDQEKIVTYSPFFVAELQNIIDIIRLENKRQLDLQQQKKEIEPQDTPTSSPEFQERQKQVIYRVMERICTVFWENGNIPELQTTQDMLDQFRSKLDTVEAPAADSLALRFRGWRLGQEKPTLDDDFKRDIIAALKTIAKDVRWQQNGISSEMIDKVNISIEENPERGYSGFSKYDRDSNTLAIYFGKSISSTRAELILLLAHEILPGHGLDSLILNMAVKNGACPPEEEFRSMWGSPYTLMLEGLANNVGKGFTRGDLKSLNISCEQVEVVEMNINLVHRIRFEILQAFLQRGLDGLDQVVDKFPHFSDQIIKDIFIKQFRSAVLENDMNFLSYYCLYYLGIQKFQEQGSNPVTTRNNLYPGLKES